MATFTKHSTGWEYRYVYKDPITKKKREKSKRGFARKADAENDLVEFKRQLAIGIEVIDMPLKDYLASWLNDYKKGTVRKNTLLSHQNNINTHIIPYFKNILLKEIKPIMYQKFINSLLENEYSRRTVEIVHSTMHNDLEKAVTIGKLEKNPCNGVEIKGPRKKKGEIKFIDSDKVPDLLKAAYEYGYIYWIFIKVLLETGMRKGEAAALQWTDINLKEMTIDINKTLDFSADEDEELFGDTKTFNSPRIIKISQSLVNDLKDHIKYQNRNKLNMNDNYHHELNLVLCRDNGNFMPKSSLFNAFERILKRADLPSVPIHGLRHTHAVIMLEAEVDMKYLQERLGHGSMRITSDVYLHISKKLEARNMDKYEDKLNTLFVGSQKK
ncbi:tyrosine-type recombinase/integrase [Paenibacillus agilis]|uniref:Site-specific integrase n=1 Tax=Paenibacillus agilis TaxID=3020863 RepID=A0A559J435_9BACL|nr:tyrosine-type recombinase/integrase [Paenibacillus agilis]TVX94637.1 site-specific integrase [Paenibacillus agilis]